MAFVWVDGLERLAERYDGFIIDVWGVLYDGGAAFPGARGALEALRRAKKRSLILSNAPRRIGVVEERLGGIGLSPDLYGSVLTSGEETFRHMSSRPDSAHQALGERCYDLGRPRFDGLLDGTGVRFVDAVDQAEFILASGPRGETDAVGDYEEELQAGLALGLPMVCANPDRHVLSNGMRVLCAGSIADRYEAMGGRVIWHGKPHLAIYRRALELLDLPRDRVLAIGDNLATDIAGARAAGIDSLLVLGGIHQEVLGISPGDLPDPASLQRLVDKAGHGPDAVAALFAW